MKSRSGKAFVIVSITLALFAACSNAANNGFSEADSGIIDAATSPGIDAPISFNVDTGTPVKTDSGDPGNNSDSGNLGSNEGGGVCTTDPPSNKCGVAPQCGCEATETCDVTGTDGTVACIAAGLGAQGVGCTTTAGCAKGLTCVGAACRPFCPAGIANNGACGVTGTNTCFYVTDGTNAIPNLHVCQINCDPSVGTCGTPDGIGNIGCVITDSTGDTDCVTVGSGGDGASCTDASSCKPGYLCVSTSMDASTPGTCRQWCKFNGGTCTVTTEKCNELNPKVVVSGVEYGECE